MKIESGMIIKTKEGNLYLVCGKLAYNLDGFSYHSGKINEEKMTLGESKIIEVYEQVHNGFNSLFGHLDAPIWRRGLQPLSVVKFHDGAYRCYQPNLGIVLGNGVLGDDEMFYNEWDFNDSSLEVIGHIEPSDLAKPLSEILEAFE